MRYNATVHGSNGRVQYFLKSHEISQSGALTLFLANGRIVVLNSDRWFSLDMNPEA